MVIVGVQDGFKMESGTAPGVSHEGLHGCLHGLLACAIFLHWDKGINKIFFNFIKYLLYC